MIVHGIIVHVHVHVHVSCVHVHVHVHVLHDGTSAKLVRSV